MTQMQKNIEKLSVLLIRDSATSMNSYRSYLNKISDIYNEPSIYIMSQAEIKQNIKTLKKKMDKAIDFQHWIRLRKELKNLKKELKNRMKSDYRGMI